MAIILMITGHAFIVHPVNIVGVPWCHAVQHWIYTFHMELFFLLAGCVYKCRDYKMFMRKKIDRILVPYIFFGLITILFHAGGGEAVHKHISVADGLTMMLLNGGNYWFLYVLFIIYALYPLVERVFNHWWKEMLLAFLFIVGRELVSLPSVFKLGDVVYYLPYFICGRVVVGTLPRLRQMQQGTAIMTILMAMAFYFLSDYGFMHGMEHMPGVRYTRAFTMMTIFYICVALWLRHMTKQTNIVKRLLKQCSKYSLQLYLLNGFILVPVRMLVCNVFHVTQPVVIVLSIVLCNLLFTLTLCKYLLPKWHMAAWLFGVGERPKYLLR